ncbi:MAG: helix-turn-helix domain-containing protein [Lachnospiraceae bacterium]
MMINSQIDLLIKHLDIKKVDFARRLKIDQSYVTRLIKGDNRPSDRLIDDICKEFSVNEEWLRTGNGEMLKELGTDEIATLVYPLLVGSDAAVHKMILSILRIYAELDPQSQKIMDKVITDLIADMQK